MLDTLRPTNATLRPNLAAMSITCCSRWMLLAKVVTTTRPVALWMMGESARPTSRSEGVNPLRAALVLSDKRASTPSSPSSENRRKSKPRPRLETRHEPGELHGALVDLPVGGVHHGADRSPDGQRDGVWNRMGHLDELDFERAHLLALPGLDHSEVGLVLQRVLGETLSGDAQRQARAVDRRLNLAEKVRQRPDVVVVSVGQHDALQGRRLVLEVGHVGHDEAGIHQQDGPFVAQGHHVHAELAQSAERHDLQRRGLLG